MIDLVALTTGIGAWWKAQTIPHINKVEIHPPLESLNTFPKGLLVVSWDTGSFESLGIILNDQVELAVVVDAMVPAGKAIETVQGIVAAIAADPSMGHMVLSTQAQTVDFSNPSQGLEGFTLRVQYRR